MAKDDPPVNSRSDKMVNTYSNRYYLEWTNTDLRIRFGEITFVTPEQPDLFVDERVAVTMSWSQAKKLRDSLVKLVAKYESANGKIKEPKLVSMDDPSKEVQ